MSPIFASTLQVIFSGRYCHLAPVLLLVLTLPACVQTPSERAALRSLAPLEMPEGQVSTEDVATRVTTPDLLAVDDAMRQFVRKYTRGVPRGRQRLLSLHRAIRGAASLGVDYDPYAEGTAIEVFHRGRANCLSYATLFVALAREAGLDASYQNLRVRPQWSLQGERVLVRLHVNALVRTRRHEQYMVDIDPLQTRDIAGSKPLKDTDAQALYHANVAMFALAENQTEEAWLHSVRALQLSPGMAQLWVNIGAVYRHAGQHREAERSYMRALELDSSSHSAMNNLQVLYELEGREEEQARWARRLESYRAKNPYYYAWHGDSAAQEEDWQAARDYYQKAVALLPDDSRLLYALGYAHYKLREFSLAAGFIKQAIERATLRSDIDAYRLQLKTVEADQAAEI